MPEGQDDEVARAVAEVAADLAARRARGELPRLPKDEMTSHFGGVVESVNARLVEEPTADLDALRRAAELPAWSPARTDPLGRFLGLLLKPFLAVTGWLVRKQSVDFNRRTVTAVAQVSERTDAMAEFLAGAHLDRLRTLERRVAELEEELDRLRQARD
ncbi:MAG: hypothetical protein ACKO04_10485 [Actinomycetes bacterium]